MKAVAVLSFIIAASATGLVHAKPGTAAFDKAAAQTGENTFAARANAGDAAGIAKLYTSDAVGRAQRH